jgi:glycosyltransferase involved in cell wall biosynthesis
MFLYFIYENVMMKSLIIMPPISLTSESIFATSFLKILIENNIEIYAIFPKGLGKYNGNIKILSTRLLLGPIISPLVDSPIIRINSFLKNIDFSANLFYSHLYLGLDLDYIIYPPGIFRKDRNPPYRGGKKIYFKLVKPIIKKLAKSRLSLCSSRYVQKVMLDNGFDCKVIYPPVIPPEKYETREKQNLVVGIGKYVPSKHWEEFIQIAKKVKQKNPTIKFKIIGGLNIIMYPSDDYYNKLKEIAGNDVELLTDVSEEEKWKIISESKVILHCMRYDNFGLGVAEAMFAGAVPVVYNSTGTWEDTIQEGKYGMGYTTVDEAKEEIIRIIEDEKTYKEYKEKAIQRATDFTIDKFERNIMEYINKYFRN